MRPTWIITAFDPFNKRPQNFSKEVLNELRPLLLENLNQDLQFEFLVVPTIFSDCSKPILQKLNEVENLQGVLSLGEAKETFRFETTARNLQHRPEMSDNAGNVLVNTPIHLSGPSAIEFDFPFEDFYTDQERAEGIELSDDAGTFVCNRLCYDLATESVLKDFKFGFIHVPRFDLAAQAGWSKERCAKVILSGFERMVARSQN